MVFLGSIFCCLTGNLTVSLYLILQDGDHVQHLTEPWSSLGARTLRLLPRPNIKDTLDWEVLEEEGVIVWEDKHSG